jgi:hypothetical protein
VLVDARRKRRFGRRDGVQRCNGRHRFLPSWSGEDAASLGPGAALGQCSADRRADKNHGAARRSGAKPTVSEDVYR